MVTANPTSPPRGVRLVLPDGTEVPCDVLREPDEDRDGCTAWIAVPQVPGVLLEHGCHLRADVLPAKTALIVRASVPDADEEERER